MNKKGSIVLGVTPSAVLLAAAILVHAPAFAQTTVAGVANVQIGKGSIGLAGQRVVGLQTTMVVPPQPAAVGTVFLWPGLQPWGANFNPIDNGVLQPVLTWGPSCAPAGQPASYSTWWISGQYVNIAGAQPGYTGCQSGPAMSVAPGDKLQIAIVLSGTTWTQTITNVQKAKSVSFAKDMQNQTQNFAEFYVETPNNSRTSADTVFTNTTITFANLDSGNCAIVRRGLMDSVSAPTIGTSPSGGTTCTFKTIRLRDCGSMKTGQSLGPGQSASSCNGRFTLTHGTNGNVTLNDNTWHYATWSTQTPGHTTSTFAMQPDGNLVLYATNGTPLWWSNTAGINAEELIVQDDGNLVIYNASGAPVWYTGTVQPSCGALPSGAILYPGQTVRSCDGRFTLAHQTDGNVVLYQGPTPLWNTHTDGRTTESLRMQTDGNFVLYGPGLVPLWNSVTPGNPGASLLVRNDGKVVVQSTGGTVLWSAP